MNLTTKRPLLYSIVGVLILGVAYTVVVYFGKTDQYANTNGLAPDANTYLIAVGDNGKSGTVVGCGDSVVPVKNVSTMHYDWLHMPQESVVEDRVQRVMEQLLANHEQYYGQSGLYNALYQSRLTVQSIITVNNVLMVALSGAVTLGGECDIPRAQAQLIQTATQFKEMNAVVTINGRSLSEALTLK